MKKTSSSKNARLTLSRQAIRLLQPSRLESIAAGGCEAGSLTPSHDNNCTRPPVKKI